MKKNYFVGTKEHPYHLSAGAIVVNEHGEILCHHYNELSLWGHPKELRGCYVLMRETMEDGETPEDAVHRGLMEEFGMTGVIIDYVGALHSSWRRRGEPPDIEKTTLYFLVRPLTQDVALRRDDSENISHIEWLKPEFLAREMVEQARRFGRTDIDESSIVLRVKGMIT